MTASPARPRRGLLPPILAVALALGALAALPAGAAQAATSPPCSTKSIDEGTAYTVPSGVAKVRITAYGAAGVRGQSAIGPGRDAGKGAKVTADVAVSAGDVLRPVRVDGGTRGTPGDPLRYPYDYGRNGTSGGAARGVVKVESDCRRYLVLAGGGGGNGSENTSSLYPSDDNYGNGLSSTGGDAGLGPGQNASGGQAGHSGRNAQEDGAGGGGATYTSGGGGGAGGRDSLSFCADGIAGGGGGFETAGAGANGRNEDDCESRSGAGGGGGGYYGGGGGGSHQDDSSGSGAGGGGSSYVIDGATNVSYVASASTQPPAPTIEPIWTPAGAPATVSAVAHNTKAYVTFTPPTAPYSIASYTITSTPGGLTTSVAPGSGALTGTVTGLTNGTAYRFSVTAVPAAGVLVNGSPATSSLSNAVTPATQVPSVVRTFQATPGDGTASLTWQAPADLGGLPILDYTITWPSGAGHRGQTATGTSATINQGLTNGQTTQFTIKARNAKGDGPTATVSVKPTAAAVPVKQPAPTGTGGNGYIDLRFTPAQPGYDQFVVTVTPAPLYGGSQITQAADYSYGHPIGIRVNFLQNNVAYRFSVAARNDKGMGPTSDLSEPITPTLTAPTGLGATVERGVDEIVVKPSYVVSGGAPVISMSAYAVPHCFSGCDVTPTITVPAPAEGQLPAEIRIPVQSGRLHAVWVAATNSQGRSTFQQVGYGSASVTPAKPTDLEVSVPNDSAGGKVKLQFLTHQNGECGSYVVTASPGGLTKTGSLGTECSEHQLNHVTFDGLTNGTEYTLTVHVVDAVTGAGPASDESDPVRPSATRPPDAVTDVVAAPAGSGKVRVRFDPSPDPDWKWPVTRYEVSAGGSSAIVYPDDVEDGVVIDGLTNAHTYKARVVARNGVGDSDPAWSGDVSPRALATPTNLSVQSGNKSLLVSFDEVENNGGGLLSYRLVIWPNGGSTYEVMATGSPVRLTNLDNFRAYDIKVYARNPDGQSPESPSQWVQPNYGSPESPVDVSATPGIGEATVSFKRPVGAGVGDIDDYVVTASPGGAQVEVAENPYGPGTYTTTVPDLTNGTSYTFTVVARNGGNDSLPSDPSSAVTPDRLNQQPIVLTPTDGTYNGVATIAYDGGSGLGAWGAPTIDGEACQSIGGLGIRFLHASTADRTCTISITKAGDDTYQPRTVTQVVTVDPADLTVRAVDRTTTYGDSFPTTVTYGGFVNGDGPDDLGGTLAFGGPAMSSPGAGPAALVPGGLTADDYDIDFVAGTVTVQRREVDLYVEDEAKTYGEPNPAFHAEATNLVGDDELDYELSTPAGTLSRPTNGPFPIVADLGDNPNYDVTVHTGELDVFPASLSITADDKTAPYGGPVGFSVTTAGLVGSDTLGSLGGTLGYQLLPNGEPRQWGIHPYGLWSPDYNIDWHSGTLTRTQLQPAISWTPAGLTYGDALAGPHLSAETGVPGTYSYSPDAGTKLSAGQHDLSVTFTPTDGEVYKSATKTIQVQVAKAPLSITADDASRTFGAANPTFEAEYDGFVNGDDAGDLGGTLSLGTTATPASPVGSYPITPTGRTSSNYQITRTPGTLEVTKAPLSVTTRDASRAHGAANPTFQVDIDGFVNGDDADDLGGALTFVTDADEDSAPGDYDVTPAGLTSGNYAITFAAGTLSVGKQLPSITWAAPDPITYGDALSGVELDATATTPGTFSYSPAAGTVLHAGEHDVTVTFTPLDDSFATTTKTVQVEVGKTPLTVTATDASRAYGAAAPAYAADYDGFVNGDDKGDLGGTLSFASDADAESGVGDYDLTPSGLTSDDYDVTFEPGTLTVTQAPLTVTAQDATRTYGAANPAFGADYDGFVNDEDADDLGGSLTFSTEADEVSEVGDYDVTPAGLTATNYAITFTPGTLSVTKAASSVSWDAPEPITYGTALSATQLDATSDLPGTFSYEPAAGAVLHVGEHAVTVTFTPAGGNHATSTTTVQVEVTKAPLTVTTVDGSRERGAANPAFEAEYDGFVNGDDAGDLGGTLAFATEADGDSPAGEYDVTPSGLTSTDYDLTFVAGTLTVTRLTPVLTWAVPQPIVYGQPLTAAQLDAAAGTAGSTTYSQPLGTVLHAGEHEITATFTPDDDGYSTVQKTVTLTVTKAPLTVTAQDATRAFGTANPAFDVAYDGFVNGDDAGDLGGALAFATTAGPASPVGDYAVTPSGLTSSDYQLTYGAGTLTVTRAGSGIVWSDPGAIEYGTALSATQLAATSGVAGTWSYLPAPGTVLPVGTHTLTATFTPSGGDHDPATRSVQIQVTRAPLTVGVAPATKIVGQANPAFRGTFTGLRNGDTADVLDGTLAFATSATPASGAGSYPVTPSGLSAANYDIRYAIGTLSVTPAKVRLTGRPAKVGRGKARPIVLSAVVTSTTTGDPRKGVRVTFAVPKAGGGSFTCSDVSDANGVARCRTKPLERSDVARSTSYGIRAAATADTLAGAAKGRLRR